MDTTNKPTMADSLLEEEVMCASASLNASCGWAVNLSEESSGFDDSFIRVQEMLEALIEHLREKRLKESVRRKIRKESGPRPRPVKADWVRAKFAINASIATSRSFFKRWGGLR
jgi:hypothetical protein